MGLRVVSTEPLRDLFDMEGRPVVGVVREADSVLNRDEDVDLLCTRLVEDEPAVSARRRDIFRKRVPLGCSVAARSKVDLKRCTCIP